MTHVGSAEEWVGFIEAQVPDILALIIETWGSLPSPAANELEDPITELLCKSLRQARSRCDLPFRIDTQLVELDPVAGQDQGRMDIVFSPSVPREDIYFCLECKRLNVRGTDGIRPYFAEYVRFGMLRFVRGQYARAVRYGGMLGIVLNGDVPTAIRGIAPNLTAMSGDLRMDAPAVFVASTLRPQDDHTRETRHRREHHSEPFVIHHLFVAGDPNAPMLVATTPTAPTRSRKRKPRNSPDATRSDSESKESQ